LKREPGYKLFFYLNGTSKRTDIMKEGLRIPEHYEPLLDLRETEKAIRLIKEFFQTNLAFELNLTRVTAPLFVKAGTGINDNLTGIERPVSFPLKALGDAEAEIVQSLAKWKRMMLADYGFQYGEGLYTDMNAIRPDEELDNLHSIYVDQWDWERVLSPEERTLDFLKDIVRRIYGIIKRTESYVCFHYGTIQPLLPAKIAFVHSEELEERYPDLTPRERERAISREHGAVFIIGIGGNLKNGEPHDGRAPDYDDWSTPVGGRYKGLNGDILVYYPILDCAFELSSMGIRVDAETLLTQLEITGETARKDLLFHRRLLNKELPLSMGGGIGQSRLCMLYLRKAHIGEIQAGIWPEQMVRKCREHNVVLL
jgi:aspartate--ammonia ligase